MNAIIEFTLLFILGMSLFIGVFYIMKGTGDRIYNYDFNIKSSKVYRDIALTLHMQENLRGNVTSIILTPSKISGKEYKLEVNRDKITFIPLDPALNIKDIYITSKPIGKGEFSPRAEGIVLFKKGEIYSLKNKY